MDLSIVIPCWNGIDDTRACLASLRDQVGAPPSEILVVDNASSDGTRGLGTEFGGVQVLTQSHNLGFAGGVNQGLRAARGRLLLLLNNDTMAAPRMVARLVTALRSDPRNALAAPVSNHVKGSAQIPLGALGAEPGGPAEIESVLDDTGHDRLQDLETLSGLCLLFRRELIDEVGLFDERFGNGNFEDDDFCLRVRRLGFRLVLARNAFLYHRGHRTFEALGCDIAATIAMRRETFAAKWAGDPLGRAYLATLDGDHAAARREAVAASARHPCWPDGRLIEGRALLGEGDPAAAARELGTFLAQCPLHTEGAVLYAFALLDAGRVAEGRQRFLRTLETCFFAPAVLARSLCGFGLRCLRLGDPVAAIEHVENARQIAPCDAEIDALYRSVVGAVTGTVTGAVIGAVAGAVAGTIAGGP